MVRATNTTMTRRTPSPDRTTFRKRWGGKPSTIRPIADLSEKSASGWITGRSCAGNEVSTNEKVFELSFGCRVDASVRFARVCGDRRGRARRAGNEAKLHGAGQRATVLRVHDQDS